MKTLYVNQEELFANIQKTIKSLKDDYENSQYCLTEDLYPIKNNTYHHIARILKSSKKDRQRRVFCSLLFKSIYKSEMLAAGSAEIAFNFAIRFTEELFKNESILKKNQVELFEQWEVFSKDFKEILNSGVVIASRKELIREINDICLDKDLAKACIEAIELAGLEGKIVVENGKQDHYIVELKNGYNFDLHAYKFFLENGEPWDRKDCKIFIVDGFVENVSELDQLLNKAFETKQPVAIISQGFSEEVVATLYTNFKQNKLDVMPLRLKSDINNLNVLNDIGIVSGKDPLSSLKGEMITFAKLEEMPTVERIIARESTATIENSKTYKDVLEQIRGLLKKRLDNQFVEDIQDIYDKRIKSLSPTIVTICLPDMSNVKADAYKVSIDSALRKFKAFLNYGFISELSISEIISWDPIADEACLPKDSNLVQNELEAIVYEILHKTPLSYESVSTLSYFLGIYLAGQVVLQVLTSSGFVQCDLETKF